MDSPEFGAGSWMFQQFVDRYASDAYGPPVGTLEAIDRAAAAGDIKSLDINHPFAAQDRHDALGAQRLVLDMLLGTTAGKGM